MFQHVVGGGTSTDDRKNIQTLDWDGNEWNAGKVTAMSRFYENDKKIATEELLLQKIQQLQNQIDILNETISGGQWTPAGI